MKASELRLTNLVQDKLTGEVLVCSGMACRSDGSSPFIEFSVLDRSKYPLPDGWQAEPIPLTEEWLLKFGFTRKGKHELLSIILNEHLRLEVMRIGEEWCIYVVKNFHLDVCFSLNRIEHVHTLQNLYFTLTGEELKINNQQW